MNICLFSSFVSVTGLILLTNTPVGRAIALVRVVFAAIALPLETVMLPLFASELFGNKSFDKVVGLFAAASTAGFAIGAPFANLCFDLLGNYNVPFIVFACLLVFVAVTMQFVLTVANRDKAKILAAEELAAEAEAPAAEAVATIAELITAEAANEASAPVAELITAETAAPEAKAEDAEPLHDANQA